MTGNEGGRFDRVAPDSAHQRDPGRPHRAAICTWWQDRFGVDAAVWSAHSFWEKGNGKLWVFAGEAHDPTPVEALGMRFMRVRQEHWKPSTNAVQRFGQHATRNVISLSAGETAQFIAGESVDRPQWDGDWGYLIAATTIAGRDVPVGVGLYLHGELRSTVPKGRQRTL